MDAFRVWIRPLRYASHVRVDGSENARWLMMQLSRSFIFKSSEPMREIRGSTCFTFEVPYSSQSPRVAIEKLLAGIPEVSLTFEAA